MAAGDVWGRFSADPRADASASLRASDADRAVAHDLLGGAFADGQIDLGEFDDRTTRVVGARTLGELLEVLRDLVPSAQAPATRGPGTADLNDKAVRRYQRDLRNAGRSWVFVSGVCVAVWGVTSAFSGNLLPFWPVFPMLGLGIAWFSVRMTAESRIEGYEDKIAEARRTGRGDDELER